MDPRHARPTGGTPSRPRPRIDGQRDCTPCRIANAQAVAYTRYESTTWTFRHISGTEASVTVGGRLRVTAAEGLRAAVLADMGLAVVSEWMFGREIASGAVVRLLPEWSLPSIDLWALFPSGRLASAKARAFADYVAGVMREAS
ncbi:LysR substrate-binding domain-containing protein [Erythrobacter sp. WG]|uniref:LysR substrate-binding domain-containing protein n=1 Tax=Erythrobacter sp. WG TaxID=2985510 RepID=UPI00226F402F|nr:LysR substrate-binding domain-containing protein [Erythrobacter sp. WG]MCX9147343.1 LysR substrate-binding domain-containing protein [Erythrobacter sp. WG]